MVGVLLMQPPKAQEHPAPHCGLVVQAVQILLTQKALPQSLWPTQLLAVPQRRQSGPPQSTSLSLPFLTPSLQVAGICVGVGGPTGAASGGSGDSVAGSGVSVPGSGVCVALACLAFLMHCWRF